MRTTLLLLFSLASLSLFAQSFDEQRSVQLQAEVQAQPPAIALSWDQEVTATSLTLYRKTPAVTFWGSPLANLPDTATQFVDTTVQLGQTYEYRLVRGSSGETGYGYMYSAIEQPEVMDRGILLLVIDSLLEQPLSAEIARYRNDVEGDGWTVKTLVVSPNQSVSNVKDSIVALYQEAPDHTHSLFLLGHVPVPYSGNIFPDGHPDHQGAWSADVFYADIDGSWTDNFVNNTVANNPRNDNIPGDGKYDQSTLPSDVELEVGRVDFHNLPAFAENEVELTRRYLDKNHAFRTAAFTVPPRGLIENNFSAFAEGFGQNGLKNFATLVGRDSTSYQDYNTLKTQSYLWSYGCGGGNYQGAGGITNTSNLAQDSLQGVFTMLFGSYFGDWDITNNFLRAALGSGTILTNAWAGRPNWQFHPMAMGHTIGYCARLTQNNPGNNYSPGFGNRSIHITLMGDPTLRMHPIAPPANLSIAEDQGHIQLNWDNSSSSVEGYRVYRKILGQDSSWQLFTPSPLMANSLVDSCRTAGLSYAYAVKATRMETTPSGSYRNLSQWTTDTLTMMSDLSVSASISLLSDSANVYTFEGIAPNADSYEWNFGDGSTATVSEVTHAFANGQYEVQLIARNDCFADTATLEITVMVTSVSGTPTSAPFRIWPNPLPANQPLLLQMTHQLGPIKVQLRDLNGRVVQHWEAALFGEEILSLEVPPQPAGLYWVQVFSEKGTWTEKIVLE